MATPRPGPALAVGWSFGFLGSLLGLVGSVRFDLPAAPSILVSLALLLVLFGAVLSISARWRPAAARAGDSV
jgi:ABC-type Mn2+/Zn2+ transport system permease subunit